METLVDCNITVSKNISVSSHRLGIVSTNDPDTVGTVWQSGLYKKFSSQSSGTEI